MRDVMVWLFIAVAIVLGAGTLLLIGYWPGIVAQRRGHPSAAAIRVCGLIGLIIWPCWFIAFIWAYTGEDRGAAAEPDYHLGLHRPPRPPHRLEEDDVPKSQSRRERRRSNRG